MARKARAVMVGIPHHVTQRGNNRQNIFRSEHDHQVYLDRLFEYAERYRLGVWGYCLMPNHIHAVVVPTDPDSMSRVIGRTAADYARYANLTKGGCGHLWQARFYSCPMDNAHAWRALAYIERNPVRAGIVKAAEEFRWSSARIHCGKNSTPALLDLADWAARFTCQAWSETLQSSLADQALRQRLREATRAGVPLGDFQFLQSVEKTLDRSLRLGFPGRPKKKVVSKSAAAGD